jgi:hypothetical protein
MIDQPREEHADRFQLKPTAESNFAWLQTRLRVEWTLMAWVRTASALMRVRSTLALVQPMITAGLWLMRPMLEQPAAR